MAPDSPPDPVIVSSDRLADLEPYCTHIYHQEPDRWSSIFPWEFPHNANREEEEAFLRLWFDEREIHMQGGAHGAGNGFRFLKSAWWWIALWNLNTRVPQFTHWWLAKPSSVELLNDPNMHPFLLRSDVQVSTFFSDELEMYGEKFLKVVIPYLQMTAREMIEKQCAEGKPALTLDTTVGEGLAVDQPATHSEPESAQPVDTTPKITQSAVCPPTQVKEAANASTVAPQTAPLPPRPFELPQMAYSQQPEPTQSSFQDESSIQPTFQQQPSVQATFQQPSMQSTLQQPSMQSSFQEQASMQSTFQEQPLNRKYSGSKRYNKNSGPSTNRRSSFKERNASVYASPPYYSQGPMPMNNTNRGSSGASMSFPQPMFQGHSFSHQDQYMGPQHAQSFGPMHQQMAQPMRYMPGYQNMPFTDPFADRSNFQEHNRAFSGERSMPHNQDPHGFRGDHRQNNYGSRGGPGGRARGNTPGRGRGRGRNSFSSNEQFYPNTDMEASHHNMPFPDPAGHVFAPRYRRESIIQEEKNWRSGSEDPQGRYTNAPVNENVAPRQASYGEMVSPSSSQSRPTPVYATKPPHEAEIERVTISDPPSAHHTARTPSMQAPPMPNLPGPENMTPEKHCGQDWIGNECVYADTLVLFNVPMSMEDEHLMDFMSQFGEVFPIRRNSFKNHQLTFVNFKSAAGARNCIRNRPDYWADGSPFRVQVSKHYWDPNHPRYFFPGRDAGGAGYAPEAQQNVSVPSHSIQPRPDRGTSTTQGTEKEHSAPEIQQSGRTTPTLSTASTPKKAKNKPKSKTKNHRQKDEEDLRKASQSSKLEQQLRAQNGDAQSDMTSVVKPTNDMKRVAESTAKAVDWKEHLDSVASLLPNPQRSLSSHTERETSSEPAFTPTDRIEARLPVVVNSEPENSSSVVATINQTPTAGNDAGKDVSEPASLPPTASSVAVSKPENADDVPQESFRDAQKTTFETETKITVDPDMRERTDEAKTSTPIKQDDTMVDDSFHTASGSPDTIKPNREDKIDAALDSTASGTVYVEDFSASPVKHNQKSQADGDITNVPASPIPAPSPDSSEKARTPQPPAISTNFPQKAETLEVPQPVSPGAGGALPTPHTAYFTAPNTPAVAQESPKEDKGEAKLTPLSNVNQSEPPPAGSAAQSSKKKENVAPTTSVPKKAEKAEKPKGPAQTESLSLFGKKREKEKKPKAGKQGTLKGKPKGFDVNGTVEGGSGNASRAASVTVQPKVMEVAETKGGEEMLRTDSKTSNTLKKRNKKKKETETGHGAGKATLEEIATRPEPSQGQASPTKRRGITERISEFFRGGQPSTSPEKTVESNLWSKLLTNDKGQDRAQEIEQKVHDHLPGSDAAPGNASVLTIPAVNQSVLNDEAHSDGAKPQPVDETESAKQDTEDVETIGLGIVTSETSSTSIPGKETKSIAKAREKSLKRKSRLSDVQGSVSTASDTPVSSSPTGRPATLSEVFHFGEGGVIKDDKSDASSVTFGRITPTSEVSPTTATNPIRKLPLKTVGSGHLVEEKRPMWKSKKKNKIHETQAEEDDDEDEDEEDEEQDDEEESDDQAVYVVPTSSNLNDMRASNTSDALDDKVFVYLGPGPRADMVREDEARIARVAESRARMAQLQREEQQAQFRQKLKKQGETLGTALEAAQTQTQTQNEVSAMFSANATSSQSGGDVMGNAEDGDGGGGGEGNAADPSAD